MLRRGFFVCFFHHLVLARITPSPQIEASVTGTATSRTLRQATSTTQYASRRSVHFLSRFTPTSLVKTTALFSSVSHRHSPERSFNHLKDSRSVQFVSTSSSEDGRPGLDHSDFEFPSSSGFTLPPTFAYTSKTAHSHSSVNFMTSSQSSSVNSLSRPDAVNTAVSRSSASAGTFSAVFSSPILQTFSNNDLSEYSTSNYPQRLSSTPGIHTESPHLREHESSPVSKNMSISSTEMKSTSVRQTTPDASSISTPSSSLSAWMSKLSAFETTAVINFDISKSYSPPGHADGSSVSSYSTTATPSLTRITDFSTQEPSATEITTTASAISSTWELPVIQAVKTSSTGTFMSSITKKGEPSTQMPTLPVDIIKITSTSIMLNLYVEFIEMRQSYLYLEVLIQQYDPNVPPDKYDSLTKKSPLSWFDINYEPSHRYRRYVAKRFIEHVGSIIWFRAGGETGCEISTGRESVCNGPLQPETHYRFQVRGKRSWESNIIEGPFSQVFTTSKKVEPEVSVAVDNDLEADIGTLSTTVVTIIAVLVCLLIFALILAAAALFWRKRSRQNPFKQRPDVSPNHARRNFFGEEFPLLSSWRRITNKPIRCKEFSNYFRLMSADSEYRFAEEYENLRNVGRENLCEEGMKAENLPKNRFGDIVPYDHSRVKLSYYDDEPGSDYINANYIHGYKLARAYLATQGPLEGSQNDFWRMVWEQNTHIIVMLTKLTERFRVKCSKYWPDLGSTEYGDLRVKLVSEHISEDWTIREFTLEDIKGSSSRVVHHFHYTSWPDHGVPKTTSEAVQFIMMVRAQVKMHHGPMVVHCSAGVGRTGTFIAIDATLHRLKEEDTVDIFGVVYHMRQDRMWMVQTEEQYIFIHQAILDFLEARELEKKTRMRDSGLEDEGGVEKNDLVKDNQIDSPLHSPGTWRYSLSLPSGLPSLFVKHRNSVTRASSAGKAEDEVRKMSNTKRTSIFLERTYSVGVASGDYGSPGEDGEEDTRSLGPDNIDDLERSHSHSEGSHSSKHSSVSSMSRPASLVNIFKSDNQSGTNSQSSRERSTGSAGSISNKSTTSSNKRLSASSDKNQPNFNLKKTFEEELNDDSFC